MVRLGALMGGGNVLKGVDGDDNAGKFAGESCEGLGSVERDVDGVVAERGAGVEQARDGVGLVIDGKGRPHGEAVLLGERGSEQALVDSAV